MAVLKATLCNKPPLYLVFGAFYLQEADMFTQLALLTVCFNFLCCSLTLKKSYGGLENADLKTFLNKYKCFSMHISIVLLTTGKVGNIIFLWEKPLSDVCSLASSVLSLLLTAALVVYLSVFSVKLAKCQYISLCLCSPSEYLHCRSQRW